MTKLIYQIYLFSAETTYMLGIMNLGDIWNDGGVPNAVTWHDIWEIIKFVATWKDE